MQEDAQVIDRLPSKFAPSLMLKKLLMPFGPTDEDRYWWAQEEPHLLKDGALAALLQYSRVSPNITDRP